MTERTYYGFNSSQDVINLQTKYSLFSRVANIMFYVTVDAGFDRTLMKQAINKLFERHDCLRITFVKKKGKIEQYFVDHREVGRIPERNFETQTAMFKFMDKHRVAQVNPFLGQTLDVVFAKNPDKKDTIIFKVSHYVCDSYGIGVLVNDLFAIYEALRDGKPMPAMPSSFEKVLQKDLEYKSNEEAKAKDKEFFKNLATVKHPEHPTYCGLHGNNSERWLKLKKKGWFSVPYLFVKCDTDGYRMVIPAAVSEKIFSYCEISKVSLSSFLFYCTCIATSLINDRCKAQFPLDLIEGRGTLYERKCAGTKVQNTCVYAEVDYEKNFSENLLQCYNEQQDLYRHTRLSYLEVEQMYHNQWKYSMISQVFNFCFSLIPFKMPKGVNLQLYTNGKGALVAYIAMILNVDTNEIYVNYDVQRKMITSAQLMDFQSLLVHVIEAVLKNPDEKLGVVFPEK